MSVPSSCEHSWEPVTLTCVVCGVGYEPPTDGTTARPDEAARVFAPSGAMCKFSPNDPVWTGAICACGPLECKAGIHPAAAHRGGAVIRRALDGHEEAIGELDVLLRERDEARQALAEANQTVVLLQHARRKDVHRMFDDVAKIVGYHGKSWDEFLVEVAALLRERDEAQQALREFLRVHDLHRGTNDDRFVDDYRIALAAARAVLGSLTEGEQ